jgi:hypothetical protein
LIQGLIDLLRGCDPARISRICDEYSPEIQRSLNYVNSMMADILDTGSSFSIAQEAVDLTSLIGEAFNENNCGDISDLTVSYDLRHKSFAHIDRIKTFRVLTNIVNNALQVMARPGTLLISTEENSGWIQVGLRNSGSYILPEHREEIFEAFFTHGKKDGSGLGLAIAKKIVDAHGGKIWCRSDKVEGTEFVFTLPATPAGLEEKAPSDSLSNASDKSPSGHFVVVDDSPLTLHLWSKVKDLGPVKTFKSPEEFWQEVSRDEATLHGAQGIITDHFFGEDSAVTGLQFAGVLRSKGYRGELFLSTDLSLPDNELAPLVAYAVSKIPREAAQQILRIH